VDGQYEIFEVLPTGSALKITIVSGLPYAMQTLREHAKQTKNECYVTDAKTRQVVAQLNVPRAQWRTVKRIFQIAYDEKSGAIRADALRAHGHGVISVVTNEKAKVLLSTILHYDLFIVGHSAPEDVRKEMVEWLRAKYPEVKILALNPPLEQISGADYNVLQNGVEDWLPIVAAS